MGVFSWNCKHCDHPILMPGVTESENKWMNDAVALLPNGGMLKGEYDGYGNVCGGDIFENGEPEVYHTECWVRAGKPTEFTGASENARDQGYFFDDGVHNSPPPGEAGFFKAGQYEEPNSRECGSCGSEDKGSGDWTCIECGEENEEQL